VDGLNVIADFIYSSPDTAAGDHHASLIETGVIFTRYLDFRLKLATILSIKEWSIVDGKAIVGNTPVVALCRHIL
jgi:hypothetical protein